MFLLSTSVSLLAQHSHKNKSCFLLRFAINLDTETTNDEAARSINDCPSNIQNIYIAFLPEKNKSAHSHKDKSCLSFKVASNIDMKITNDEGARSFNNADIFGSA